MNKVEQTASLLRGGDYMRVRRCYIPNCSASAMELVIDLHTALEEFFKLADEVKVEVIEKKEDKYETLHKGTVDRPDENA